MAVDLQVACRMAKASDVCYYAELPGGPSACRYYADIGFTSPTTNIAKFLITACVGTTATEIIAAFSGLAIDTADWDQFIETTMDQISDAEDNFICVPYADGLVHQGFARTLELLWRDVVSALNDRLETGLPVVLTGHGTGGALASLAAIRLKSEAGTTPAAVYTFGAPPTGNERFSRGFNAAIPKWRFENGNDIVPRMFASGPQWFEFFSRVDPRLRQRQAHVYLETGVLEYLKSDGSLREGDSLELEGERMINLFRLLESGNIKDAAVHHSLEDQYIAKVCALAR